MASVNEQIVRDYLEILGFFVIQPNKYQVAARKKTAIEEIDMLICRPEGRAAELPEPGLWGSAELHDVDKALGAQWRKMISGCESLSRRKRNSCLSSNLTDLFKHLTFELRYFLDPKWVKLLNPVAELHCRIGCWFAMGFHDDVKVRPNHIANLGEVFYAATNRDTVIDWFSARIETALDASPSVFFLLSPQVQRFLRRLSLALLCMADSFQIALVTVQAHFVSGFAAQQLPDWLAKGFA